MRSLRIRGGRPLCGEITVSGGKNAALPVLAAAVLFRDVCFIHNCPDLTDVDAALEILEYLGACYRRQGTTVIVDPRPIRRWDIPEWLMSKMRGSLFFMGPLMARFGRFVLRQPGGCPLGARPVDFHLSGLRQLGASIDTLECSGKLTGCEIHLPFPSVGATENLLMAALGAEGVTTIHNAAREPEIVCLCDFLRSGGCDIQGDGSGRIRIAGGLPQGGRVTLIPDRMEAATYLCAAAAAGGRVVLHHGEPGHLRAVIDVLRRAGCGIEEGETMTLRSDGLTAPGEIVTGPYPEFPTDAQAPIMAALLRAKGECLIRERVFSHRMHHIPALRAMGGDISLEADTALIRGVDRLHGASVEVTDLRGGAALMIAALAAEGETKITGLGHLLRGYEDIPGKLRALGAQAYLS